MGTLAMAKETRCCPICGKPYILKVFCEGAKGAFAAFLQRKYGTVGALLYVSNCSCEREEYEREQRKIEFQQRQEALNKRFENSLMSPFFQTKRFEILNDCEHKSFCQDYANDFNPKTSLGIQMIGDVGTGKTTLLAAICNELIRKGYSCLFMTFSSLIENVLVYSSEHSGDISERLNWLKSFDFVVLDDIGRESYNTERRNEIAFRIIDTLLNYKIVTCFSANPEMISRLKDVWQQSAAIDRLKDMCPHKLIFKGESMRGENNGT